MKVTGKKLDNFMIIAGSEGGRFQILEYTLAPQVVGIGNKKIAVIMFNFQDNTSQPFTTQAIHDTFNSTSSASVKTYYEENSYNKLHLSADVYGWYTLSLNQYAQNPSPCSALFDWADAADALATQNGVNLANYDYVSYVFPLASGSGCFSGLAEFPGRRTWFNGTTTLYILAHELGHNFGNRHASSYSCKDSNNNPVPVSNNCTQDEYGDPWDVMGSNLRHMNNYHKTKIGSIDPSEVHVATTTGTFVLNHQAASSSEVKMLKIPRNSSSAYYLEYRQPYGVFDATIGTTIIWNGIAVRLGPPQFYQEGTNYFTNNTQLLSLDPQPTYFKPSLLTRGNLLEDTANGIYLSVENATPGAALVKLDLGTAPCVHNFPSITFNEFTHYTHPNQEASYSATVKNNDNTACSSSTFTITPTFPNGSWYQPTTTVNLAPKEQKTISIKITPPADAGQNFELYQFSETITHSADSTLNTSAINYITTFGLPIPNIQTATVVTSTNPWTAWKVTLTGQYFSYSLKAKIYDQMAINGAIWADNVPTSVSGDQQSLTFALPAKRPPSNCNLNSTCDIQFQLIIPETTNPGYGIVYTNPVTITLPQNSQSDVTPPTVAITYPSDGYILPITGGINVQATASDTSGIDEVKLYFDGSLVKICAYSPCAYWLAVSSVSAGTHTTFATALDNASPYQNGATSSAIMITKQ